MNRERKGAHTDCLCIGPRISHSESTTKGSPAVFSHGLIIQSFTRGLVSKKGLEPLTWTFVFSHAAPSENRQRF